MVGTHHLKVGHTSIGTG